jgi:hypothetical protein
MGIYFYKNIGGWGAEYQKENAFIFKCILLLESLGRRLKRKRKRLNSWD